MWPSVQRVPSQAMSQESCVGDGSNGAEQQVRSSLSSDGAEAEAEELLLPLVSVQMVGLGDIVERLVTFAYTELVTLVDTLPSRAADERRGEIVRYADHVTSLLTSLLVLVRWARSARQIQKCQNAIAYLDAQNRFFEGSVDSLYAAFLALAGVRVRNYDVGTAVDVLTTGSYRRLPRAIARSVGRPRLGRRQVAQALRAIDDIIRARMLGGEAVPLAMRQYAVGGGRIVFRVRGEFEATLTLLQRGAAIPWHVVGVRMLAGGDVPYSSQKILVDSITQHAQQILVDAAAGGGGGAPQLAQLYDFLHRQALAALLDAVARQAAALRRARWEGALAAETSSDRAAVVLRYWASSSSSSSAASSSVGSSSSSSSSSGANSVELRIVALPVPRPIHAPAAEGAQAAAVAGDCAFARIERARRDLIPKAGLRITWTAAAGLAAPQTWTRTAAALGDLAGDGWRLAVDPAAVDVERLLRQATAQHASAVLEGLRAAVAAKQHLGLGVEESKDAAANQITTSLRAWFRPGEGAVDFSVDGVSGRLAATLAMDGGGLGGGGGAANMSSASLSAADAFRVLADRANRSPWRVAELLVDLRAALALADLDALAERALGLRRQESASGFPLRVSQADADMLARDVGGGAGVQRLRFYGVEGTEGDGAWFVMAAMTDRLRFRLVRLSSAGSTTAATAAGLVRDVTQVEALQVDRLFASVARRLSSSSSSSGGSKQPSGSKESFCARAEAMLAGRTAIGLDYVNALASAVRARLAVRAVQAQLAAQRIAYAFRLPKFSTSPHGPRAAVSQELSVVGIDRMGVYELDEHVPVLYVPVAALMRAAPVNWRVAARAVLPDEARRMVSLRVAADEATSSLPAPCHVVAQLPVALGGLPQPVAQAYADAVYLSSHASADGGYHQHQHQNQNQHQHQSLADGSGYSKIVRVYRRVATAVQRLIRDWAELHLMAHVARHLFAWEQRALRRVLASTVAYYPASLGPYTKAAVAPLPLPCSPEIVVQCLGSCFLSISCCVPSSSSSSSSPSAAQADHHPLTYHLTLADVDPKSGQTVRIASTWPCCLQNTRTDSGLSRWLRTLQARLNLSGNPLAVLSIIVQMMPISHILRSIEAVSTIRCSQPSSLPAAAPGDPGGTTAAAAAAAAMDQAHVVLQKIASMTNDVTRAFESVRELNVMHMYTAADNMRLVFNSRYVVDLRLVSSDLFHITDAVGAIRRGKGNSPKGRNDAPEPLVTPATEPIPLFADWLDAMARGMRFDWEKLEKFVSAIFSSEGGSSDYLEGGGDDDGHDSNRVRLFQRNLHRLRPGASKVEQYLYRFREMTSKQNSARAPTFVVLPPAAILCTRLHLVPVLRSLMHWLVQSVHVRDLLESAIARTLELVDQQRQQGLFCVKEKLVYTEEIASAPSTSGGGKQVMIVGFTGSRDSVRCEFLMQAGVTAATATATTNAKVEKEEEEKEEEVEKEEAEKDIDGLALLSDLYSVPSTLMRVDLDVRIVPLNRPPNGITDAAAALLIKAFKRQTTDIRQRAGVLVRILALPPQLVMDIVDIAKRLPTKADVCAITRGLEHLVRIDALNAKVSFTMRFDLDNNAAGTGWSSDIVIEYELVEGVASIVEGTDVWRARVAAAVAALDQQTAFTRDMGKSGKSRWFDIINKLCETTE